MRPPAPRDLPPPLGVTLRRGRRRVRRLRRPRRRGRGLPLRRGRPPTARTERARAARRARPRHVVRLRARHRRRASATPCGCDGPWRPAEGLRHNPAKLLLDPYARAIEGEVHLAPRGLRPPGRRRAARRPRRARRPRQRAAYMPRCVVVDDDFDWGDDAPPHGAAGPRRVIYEAHVRRPDPTLHPDVPEELRGTYAGLAHPAVVDAPHRARRHRRRAAAGARLHLRAGPGPARADEPLGLQHAGLLRPARGVRRRRRPAGRARRVQGHGQGCCTASGIEVILDVVYNHTAEQDAPAARRCRWRGLDNRAYYRLDERGQRHRRHRLRQHPRPAPPGGLPDGARLAALLGAGVPRRRLPVRPRRGARPRPRRRLRPRPPVPRGAAHRPGAVPGQAHRRAVGRRHARLAHRPVPAAVRRVERPLPRRACGPSGCADAAPRSAAGQPGHGVRELATRLAGSQDLFGAPRPRARSPRSTSSPPTTASPLADLTAYDAQAQRRQRRGQPRRARRQPVVEPRRRGRAPTTRTSLRPAGGRCATCSAPCCCPPACRCSTPATRSAAPSAATTTPTARTTRSPGSTGTSTVAASDLLETTRHLAALRRDHPVLRQRAFFTGRPVRDGRRDRPARGSRADGQPMDQRPLGRPAHPHAAPCTSTAPRRTPASLLVVLNGDAGGRDGDAARASAG